MRVHRVIRQSSAGSDASGALSVPSELLEESRRRVGIAAIAFAFLWLFAILLNDVLRPLLGKNAGVAIAGWNAVGNVAAMSGVILSLATALLATRATISTRAVLHAGVAFQIVCAALVATVRLGMPYDVSAGRHAISWICLVILAYPMIAPMSPHKTLVAGLACAAIDSARHRSTEVLIRWPGSSRRATSAHSWPSCRRA